MTEDSKAASAHIFDATEENFEADVLQASLQQPVLVDFWADWCAPCKALTPVLEKVVADYNGALTLAKVNVDTQQQLAAAIGVQSLPTVVLVKEGRVVDGFNGALPEAAVREFLARHVQPGAPAEEPAATHADAEVIESPTQAITRLQQQLAKTPGNQALKLDLAVAQLRAGNAQGAQALIDDVPEEFANDERARRVRAHLEFARELAGAPAAADLHTRIEANANDFSARDLLGVRLLLEGQTEAALDTFLENLRLGRGWNDGQAKKRLIAAFSQIDDADLVGRFRRKMSALLF